MNVVYRTKCNDCDVIYIGETKRSLRRRAADHSYAVTASNTTHSGLAEHCIAKGHSVNSENFDVIDCDSNVHKRRIKESLHIAAHHNTCNVKGSSYSIPTPWLSVCACL